MLSNNNNDGISLRTIHRWLIVGALIISALMFYSTYHLSASFSRLAKASEQQIELRKAARELMDASDYLTEQAQRFTIDGDMEFLNNYFEEAFKANHREEALSKMSEGSGDSDALHRLQAAMDSSVALMDQEYYAMKLVISAKGYTDYPEILKDIELSKADSKLDDEDKMRRATELLLSDDYYDLKEKIRSNMRASLDELERMAYNSDASEIDALRDEMLLVRLVIMLQTLGIVFMVWLTSRLGIHPVLNAVDRIQADNPIPEAGANEFRYLARAYNKMYDVYKRSLEYLNFKASHDELTGAYNRSGYELLLSSIDLNSTYMLLFDVDDFKHINDNYGHETGDKVLTRFVQVLRSHFRSDDYICRIGGDEFVVFMVHSTENQRNLVESKIEKINDELAMSVDGLPPVSVSVGITHGSKVSDAKSLFEKTDEAMYQAKQSGKNTFAFYQQ